MCCKIASSKVREITENIKRSLEKENKKRLVLHMHIILFWSLDHLDVNSKIKDKFLKSICFSYFLSLKEIYFKDL